MLKRHTISFPTVLTVTLFAISLLGLLVPTAQALDNTVLGTGAGASLNPTEAHDNTLLGEDAGAAITDEDGNTMVGAAAGVKTTGSGNTFVGQFAGEETNIAENNTFIGNSAGGANTTGNANTYLGAGAALSNQTGSRNVFVGGGAGANELGSDKLYIDGSITGTSSPLIYGEFDNDILGINGHLGVGTQIPLDKLHVLGGNLRIEQIGADNHATLNFVANGNTWEIKNNKDTGRLTFFAPGGGATTASFKFDRQAQENLFRVGVLGGDTVDINGDLVVTGTLSNPDYVFEPEYSLESIQDHAAYMWQHHHLPAVGAGQINAQGHAMVNVATRSQGMLEELEKAHIYIEQLKGESDQKVEQIAALTLEVTANETQLEVLKSKVSTLKAKEARLETLENKMVALEAMMQQRVRNEGVPSEG